MAKGNGKSPASENGQEKPQPAYFKSLTIEDVKCFKGKHTIDLSDGNEKPAQWTVILGNNNTGKTTILKCLAMLTPGLSYNSPSKLGYGVLGLYSHWPNENYENTSPFSISATISSSNDEIRYIAELEAPSEDDTFLLPNSTVFSIEIAQVFIVYSYGASRKMSTAALSESEEKKPHSSLIDHQDLPNMEDWLLSLYLADQLGQTDAKKILDLAKQILSSDLLPDVQKVNLNSREKGAGFVNFVEFLTDFGWIRLRNLGYGYQTMIAWVLDLVKRMVERYPNSSNPLAEPAIVLVDEIDLHLHPDWQRKIISHLTKYFPNTQFIATAHSPLIVQSAEEVNVVILKKVGESVIVEQPKIRSFRGWTVEEILTDLMDLEGQTMSQTYLELMEQYDDALDSDDFEKAEDAFKKLDKILHPDTHQRKLLQLQMTSLSPANAI